jgi:hypothetical protein
MLPAFRAFDLLICMIDFFKMQKMFLAIQINMVGVFTTLITPYLNGGIS